MKIQNLTTALFLTMIIGFLACKNDTPKTLIVSKWRLTDWILVPSMNVPDSVKTEMLKAATLEFTADNNFHFLGLNGSHSDGTYKISEDGKVLTLSPKGADKPYDNPVEELTKTKLVMIDPMGNKLVCSR